MNNQQKEELLEYYKNLLILQYNQQGGTARATIETIVKEVLGALIAKQVEEGFSVDTSVGYQLDILAEYVGLQRYEVGFGNLSDEELRILIKFAILKYYNPATTQAIASSLYALFGYDILFADNKDMTFRYAITDNISDKVQTILKEKDLLPRPMGVGIEVVNIDRVFGFDGSGLQPFDQGVFYSEETSNIKTLTINCNIPDATVIINNVETRSRSFEIGAGYTWSINKSGFTGITGTGTMGSSDTAIDISSLVINAITPNSTVVINGTEQNGIFFKTENALAYTYSVSSPGYITETGSGTIYQSKTINVSLGYNLTINAPAGANVQINGISGNTALLPKGSFYTWTVSGAGFATASGNGTITENTSLNVYTVSGANAIFNFNQSGKESAYALANTTVSYVASYAGCISYSGTKYITQDTVITMATLTAIITPTPDEIKINKSKGNVALFEDGNVFSYTIEATKMFYKKYTHQGSILHTGTVEGTMIR